MKQFTAFVLTATTFLNVGSACAQTRATGAARSANDALTQARGTLAAYRAQQRLVRAELANGSTVTGHIGDIQKSAFYIVPVGSRDLGWRIRYSELTALTDDTIAERLMTVASPLPNGPVPRLRPEYKAWIVAGAAVGIFVIWAAINLRGNI